MAEITVAGRTIPLVFNVDSWDELEKEVCVLAKINTILGKRDPDEKTSDALGKLISIVRVLGNQGLELEDKERDLTDKWLKRNIKPRQMLAVRLAAIAAIDDGMELESQEDEGKERDLVLEEINQKKTPSE